MNERIRELAEQAGYKPLGTFADELMEIYNKKFAELIVKECVHVGIQNGVFCVWALGDTEDPMVERSFTVVGTGWELDEFHIHLGTVFQDAFVWHIMEIA